MKITLNHLFVIIVSLAVVPLLFMRGMFMDGAMYTAVSLNMAEGIGDFWQPIYGKDFFGLDGFYENPPLGIFSLSLFFKIFGDSFWVERLFLLTCYTLSLFGQWLNVREVTGDNAKYSYWLLLVLWFIIPTVFWTFRQNMMEVQIIPLLLLGNWCFIRYMRKGGNLALTLLLFSLSVVMSFMIKGPVGIYLIVAPFVYFIVFNFDKGALKFGFLNIALSSTLGASLLFFPKAQNFFNQYLFIRTAERIKNNPTVESRFWILWELFQQLLPALLLTFGLLAYEKFTKRSLQLKNRWSLYFAILAMAGSFPLMISYVQRPFYLATSFPFYALALFFLVSQHGFGIGKWVELRLKAYIKTISITLLTLLIGLTIVFWGSPRRDEELLADIKACAELFPELDKVYVTDQLIYNWSLKAYMMRNNRVDVQSFHGFDPDISEYVLSDEYIPETHHGEFKLVKQFNSFTVYHLIRPSFSVAHEPSE